MAYSGDQPDLTPVCLPPVFWTATSHVHIGTEHRGHNYEVCDHTLEWNHTVQRSWGIV